MIRREMLIEELVTELPESVAYLLDKGINALACGEPVWGTLEDAAKEKGYTNEQIKTFVAELSELLVNKS
ncbi:MAG: DUF1858 domain-containing protein [Bacteroidota bacterium]|nr:DUF1858 domain-containing protein [Bacteroidota bacterium]